MQICKTWLNNALVPEDRGGVCCSGGQQFVGAHSLFLPTLLALGLCFSIKHNTNGMLRNGPQMDLLARRERMNFFQ